ncbi:hypothetical protein ACHAWC_011029 [Mediolabrus comicus]
MKTRNSPIIASTNNNNDEAKSSPRKAPPPSLLSLDDVVDTATNVTTAAASSPAKRRKIDLEQKMMSGETTTTVSTTAVGGGRSANHETALVEAAGAPSTSTNVVTTNNNNTADVPSSIVHKTAAVSTSTPNPTAGSTGTKIETIDVATILGVKPGDRIEVKWNINEEDDDDDDAEEDPSSLMVVEGGEKEKMGLPKTEGEDEEPLPQKLVTTNNNNSSSSASSPAPTGMVSVWWKATIQKATGTYHILDDEEATSSGVDSSTFGAVAAVNAYNSAKKPPSSSSSSAAATTSSSATSAAGKDEKVYNCPKCAKRSMSKQGLYTHYGMVHGGKLSRDYPNLDFLNNNHNNHTQHQKKALPNVRVPIYEIVYDPLPQMGFPDYSTEEIAFISNVTLLNLSTEEMMNFRKEGDLASPAASSSASSPVGAVLEGGSGEGGGKSELLFADEATTTTTTTNNPNEICKEFRTEDDIRQYMNELMQKTMLSTGLNSRMDTLPRSQQNVIATRINKALEGLLGKIMEETGRMEGGSRVVTAEVVRRCMDQMGRV